jgi:hypothetical protein
MNNNNNTLLDRNDQWRLRNLFALDSRGCFARGKPEIRGQYLVMQAGQRYKGIHKKASM